MGGGVGGFPTRSRRIKMDQEGSVWIKGDHCDGWGCGWVSNQIKEDQDGSRWIKKDQGRSKEITVMGGGLGVFPTRSRRIKMDQEGSVWIKGDHCDGWGCGWVSNQIKEDQDGSRRISVDQRRSL